MIDNKDHIAYFSMEIGISHNMPTYAGGLGILAGDLLKSYADLRVPIIGITLINSKGYFNQEIDNDGNQIEKPVDWNINKFMELMPNTTSVTIEGREVKLRVWKHVLNGCSGHDIPVYFLDSNVDTNSDYDKSLTAYLYGGDRKYRLGQEIILGIGGVRILKSLGYNVKKYHMNEGHSALLTVELLKETYKKLNIDKKTDTDKKSDSIENKEDSKEDITKTELYDENAVKDICVFTTHTPIEAGHDKFDIDLFDRLLGNYVPKIARERAIHDNVINMTFLAMNYSKYVNGVAKRHGEVTREMFPQYVIDHITNGIHPQTWISPSFAKLFDKYMPGWIKDPFTLRYALSIPKEEILNAHIEAKKILIEEVNYKTGLNFDPLRFTIGYARRFTAYKRPDMILQDINRLIDVAQKVGDIQIIFSGKAHVHDYQGKEIMRKIIQSAKWLNSQNVKVKIAFLTNYDMYTARKLVAGCDIWLNNPQRPYEASGTSGMKAALNGVPQVSTLDGWWIEGCIENLTGWSLGPHPQDPGFNIDPDMIDESRDLYNKLESTIIPTFYGNKEKWADIMRHSIAINASFFNTYRMAQQYMANAYIN